MTIMRPPLLDGLEGHAHLETRTTVGHHRAPTRLSEDDAWGLVLGLRARIRIRGQLIEPVGLRLGADGALHETCPNDGWIVAHPRRPRRWAPPAGIDHDECVSGSAAQVLDLYMPLCVGAGSERMVAAHLAQSLDGRVATANGTSQFISGQEDLVHTHRMRALFDAVVVGARTVEHDDPRLTTRLAEGDNPTRVVLDPRARLQPTHRIFTDDVAPTIVVRGPGHAADFPKDGHTKVLEVEVCDGWLSVVQVVGALRSVGLKRIFVEGGGVTVSGFLKAGMLDRLHVTVAPMLIGSGRPAFSFPEIERLDEALRLQCQHFALGRDILFDCPLTRSR